jgi:sporulation protein YlmC with PRC-barrel domain
VKNFTVAAIMTSLTLGGVLDAAAQTRPAPREPAPAQREAPRETWQKPDGAVDSSKLIGARIKNAEGKDLGEIDGLVVSSTDGKVTHVIVGRGGIAGIGETKVVVPWSDMQMRWDRDRDNIVVSMEQSKLDTAPRYQERRAARERDRAPAASPGTTPRSEEKKK